MGKVVPLDLDKVYWILVDKFPPIELDFVDVVGFEDGADCRTLPDSSIDGALAIESAVDGLKSNGLLYVRELYVQHVQFRSPSHDSEIGETTRVSVDDGLDGLLVLEDDLVNHGLVVCHDTAFCHVQTLFWKRKLLSLNVSACCLTIC